MQEILKAFAFETQIAFLKTSSETFRHGLKKLIKTKNKKKCFFSNRVCLLNTFH